MTFGNQQGMSPVTIEDQSLPIVDYHMTMLIDTGALNVAAVLNSEILNINMPTLPVIGDTIILKNPGGDQYYLGTIVTVTPDGGDNYTLDVDTPLDFAFQTDAATTLEADDMAVDGSSTIAEFRLSAVGLAVDTEFHVVRVAASMLSTGPMDDGLFGDQVALPKGIVFRTENDFTKNIFNAKTNGEIKEHAYDLEYADKAPSGQFGMTFRRTFGGQEKNGVVVLVAAKDGEAFKCLIQDDLTGLISFKIAAQGHVLRTGIGL